MTTLDINIRIREGLQSLGVIKSVNDCIRVTTQCMYPSNGLVNVAVRAGPHTVVVSDDGGAVSEAQSAGIKNIPTDKFLARLLGHQGIKIEGGVIYSPHVPLESVHLAVILIANASKELSEWLYRNARIKIVRDFKVAVTNLLQATFDDKLCHRVAIQGERATHKFANVIRLDDHRKLIVDAVVQEQSSISARIIANLDVLRKGDANVMQRIVYDDYEPWNPDNLALLGMSDVPLIAFSQAPPRLQRMALSA